MLVNRSGLTAEPRSAGAERRPIYSAHKRVQTSGWKRAFTSGHLERDNDSHPQAHRSQTLSEIRIDYPHQTPEVFTGADPEE